MDREKLIEALDKCYGQPETCGVSSCPYWDLRHPYCECEDRMRKDAIAVLKENEPQQAELRNTTWYCPRCRNPVTMFDYGEFNKYCGFCGQRVIF